MLLLTLFAFLAGIVTVLSPCILPILPIVLSSSVDSQHTSKARPLGIVTGFILSFTFFTLFLSTIVSLSGIPADLLRLFSVVVIATFGVSLLIPQLQSLLEKLFSKLAVFMPHRKVTHGFIPGLVVGLSIGLLWTPCVGPILASVISLAITGTVTISAFIITLAYALGTAIPMFAIMIGGQKILGKVPWLLANTYTIQKAFGVVMILTAFAIFNNYDRAFQTYIVKTFPQYGINLTKFEDTTSVKKELEKVNKKPSEKETIGKPTSNMTIPKGPIAPEIISGGVWFNTKPLTLADLKGKVIIIDFWTYSCINCQRTLPYLKDWYKKYKDQGLVIIGVHSPEFTFEKNEKNVAQAIKEFGLIYPIVQDNDFATWQAYNNRYWPAKYFIDKDGYIRHTHFGEGAYDESEKVIQKLLTETGEKNVTSQVNNPTYKNAAKTPETYLGYDRIQNFASPEKITYDTISQYTAPVSLAVNQIAYIGNWNIMNEYANPQKGATLLLHFDAKEVFLVMRTKGKPTKIKVYLDDTTQHQGVDNKNGIVTVDKDSLYKLINLATPGQHILRLEFEDNNTELFAFTFG